MKRAAIASMLAITLIGTSVSAGTTKTPVISSQSVEEEAKGATAEDAMRLMVLIALGIAIVTR